MPNDEQLNHYELLKRGERGVRGGCKLINWYRSKGGSIDCQQRKPNLSMGWVDVKKAYGPVDHGWLKEMMLMHRFPPPPPCAGVF